MLNKLKSSVTNQTKTKGENQMLNKLRNRKNVDVNFDKNKGGNKMFKTITKGAKNIAKNSKVGEVVETKVRERKVKKIIREVKKEQEERELRAIVDFVVDSVEKDEDVMERLKKLSEGDIKVVNEKVETKKKMFKKKIGQTEESEAYKEGKKIAEDMKDRVHDIFPVDPASRFVGPFANKNKDYVSKDVEEFGENVQFYDEKEKKSFKGTFDEFMSNKDTKLFFGKKKGSE